MKVNVRGLSSAVASVTPHRTISPASVFILIVATPC
jgi:hypothetical protein